MGAAVLHFRVLDRIEGLLYSIAVLKRGIRGVIPGQARGEVTRH